MVKFFGSRNASVTPAPASGSTAAHGKVAVRHRKRKVSPVGVFRQKGFRRLMYSAGITRVQKKLFSDANEVSQAMLRKWIAEAMILSEYDKRTTITEKDILEVLRRNGAHVYGICG